MAPKTFADYAEMVRKDPYPFPMPDGATITVAQPTIRKDGKATAAAVSAGNVADGLIAGLRVYVADDEGNDPNGYGDKVAEAWGTLPTSALAQAVSDMRDHFTTLNEDA